MSKRFSRIRRCIVAFLRAIPPRWVNRGYIHFRNRYEAERLYLD